MSEKPKTDQAENYRWYRTLIYLLVGLILFFTFVGRIVVVDGSSMEPTLHNGEVLFLLRAGYAPRQGDVVVLNKPTFRAGDPIVKRVVAVGGQSVDIDYGAGTVCVDGAVLDEPYILEPMRALPEQYATHAVVPEGSLFVMGDNRNGSADSRDPALGVVDARWVLGRALFVFFPFGDAGVVASVSHAAAPR